MKSAEQNRRDFDDNILLLNILFGGFLQDVGRGLTVLFFDFPFLKERLTLLFRFV